MQNGRSILPNFLFLRLPILAVKLECFVAYIKNVFIVKRSSLIAKNGKNDAFAQKKVGRIGSWSRCYKE